VTGDNVNARIDLTSPLLRTRYENLVLLGAIAYAGTETELTVLATSSDTDLVYGELGLFWNHACSATCRR
jgi:hypothetical protein